MFIQLALSIVMAAAVVPSQGEKLPANGISDGERALRTRQAQTCRPGDGVERDYAGWGHHPGIFVASANLPRVAWDPRLAACAVNDTRTAGANIVIPWSKVEREPGVYDWSYVFEEVAPWRDRGQRVNLLFWGSAQRSFQHIDGEPATPAHILKHAPTVLCTRADGQGGVRIDPYDFPVPIHYAPAYREPYLDAVEAFVRRFEEEPWVNYLRVGIGVGAESYPANRANGANGVCRDDWEAAGFTPEKWREHVLFMVHALGALRPKADFVVTLNDIDGLRDLPDEVAALAVEEYGFGIGTQGATARAALQYNDETRGRRCYANWCVLFERYRDRGVPLEIQTPSASNPRGLREDWGGRTGPLPAILDFALARGATSIELYPAEWFIANTQDEKLSSFSESYDAALTRTADQLDDPSRR